MSDQLLRPARLERLVWHAPAGLTEQAFSEIQPRLEKLVTEPRGECVYQAKRRAIHRVQDEILGPLAVKEIRSDGCLRSVWFRFAAEHPGLREFRVGSEFQARGGATPAFLGAMLEGGFGHVDRVVIFMHWIEGAVELAQHLRDARTQPDRTLFERVAKRLVDDARLGLVHGRHSTNNLLLVPRHGGEPEIQVIDFAYSSLGEGLDPDGYEGDVARVAVAMVLRGRLERRKVREFIEIAAQAAQSNGAGVEACRGAIEAAANRLLVETTGRDLEG
ncbi:MAG: hypothetical protein IH884_02495 [Myxococcales bacterium]|nr:hypothetical protein [Myxococcales bacterium]